MPTRVLLDVDTGTDDALALLYAAVHPDLELVGVSCVSGNAGLDHVLDNTAKVLDAAGAPALPIAGGAKKPLYERQRPDFDFHGADGLGGISLPDTRRDPSPTGALKMLRDQILAAGDPITLVALAPQTNIALLLSVYPEVADRLERIIFMGGSASMGNTTAVAEFNVWQDPEAAAIVVQSDVPATMYGLDVFNRLLVGQAHADRFRASDHPAVRLAGDLLYLRGARSDGSEQPYEGVIGDAGALVLITNPDLFTVRRHPVRVNLEGIGRGQTVVDQRPDAQDAEKLAADPWSVLDVALDLDLAGAAQTFVEAMERFHS